MAMQEEQQQHQEEHLQQQEEQEELHHVRLEVPQFYHYELFQRDEIVAELKQSHADLDIPKRESQIDFALECIAFILAVPYGVHESTHLCVSYVAKEIFDHIHDKDNMSSVHVVSEMCRSDLLVSVVKSAKKMTKTYFAGRKKFIRVPVVEKKTKSEKIEVEDDEDDVVVTTHHGIITIKEEEEEMDVDEVEDNSVVVAHGPQAKYIDGLNEAAFGVWLKGRKKRTLPKKSGPTTIIQSVKLENRDIVASIVTTRVNHDSKIVDVSTVFCIIPEHGIVRKQLLSVNTKYPLYMNILYVNSKNNKALEVYKHLNWKEDKVFCNNRDAEWYRPVDSKTTYICLTFHGSTGVEGEDDDEDDE